MPSTKVLLSTGTAFLLSISGYSYISGNPWFFERIFMPTVAKMDPEKAHLTAVYIASKGLAPKDFGKDPPILVFRQRA